LNKALSKKLPKKNIMKNTFLQFLTGILFLGLVCLSCKTFEEAEEAEHQH